MSLAQALLVVALAIQALAADPTQELSPVSAPATLLVEQDPITDAVSVFANIEGPDGRLSVGCDPDRFEGVRVRLRARAWFAGENGFTDRTWVRHRFDQDRPRRSRWSTEDGAAWLQSRRELKSILPRLLTSDQVAIRTEDVEGRKLDFVFALSPARPVLHRMLGACGVDPLHPQDQP